MSQHSIIAAREIWFWLQPLYKWWEIPYYWSGLKVSLQAFSPLLWSKIAAEKSMRVKFANTYCWELWHPNARGTSCRLYQGGCYLLLCSCRHWASRRSQSEGITGVCWSCLIANMGFPMAELVTDFKSPTWHIAHRPTNFSLFNLLDSALQASVLGAYLLSDGTGVGYLYERWHRYQILIYCCRLMMLLLGRKASPCLDLHQQQNQDGNFQPLPNMVQAITNCWER